ncbi:MAG: QueT transporter family protein [Bacilli bacterium]|jgi:uncharacterized membrane protein|nr:QueT transporter family protein [Bacilli bacterium]MCH4228146.1 QueT transporter family protein [Bacilli bacterium]MCH4278144.1 QueT transporter family protein [Bacilli bacterium]MCI2054548.1 QueT transporter family protein [Bacilli bacterium]
MNLDITTRKIAQNGIVAACYFVVTIATSSFSYGQIQFRIAEMLILLCFWRPDFILGVTLGCLLANINSTLGPWDILIGTMATFVSSLLVAYASPRLLIGALYPILINAFAVGWELNWLLGLDFWVSVLYVGIGEAAVIIISYILWLSLSKNKGFMSFLSPKRHLDVKW